MKIPIALVLTVMPIFCVGAPSYTSYFNNVHVYTNITLGGVTRNTWPSSSGIAGTVINTVAESGLLSVDSTKTNGIAATPAHVVSALSAGESSTVLKYTSGLADNATNVALVVDTDEAWAARDLAAFRNMGTNRVTIQSNGKINAHDFSAVALTNRNDVSQVQLYLESADSSSANFYSFASLYANGGNGANGRVNFNAESYNLDGGYAEFTINVNPSGASGGTGIWIDGNAATTMTLNPTAAATTAAYRLDTEIAHTDGNLLEVVNSTTNKFVVGFDGRITTQGGAAITPANASATGTAGTILWDSGFIYVCVAANTWKRVAIATW